MMLLAQSLVTEAAALAVAGAAICRLARMHIVPYEGERFRISWVAVFLAMFFGSVVALWEVAEQRPSWSSLLLLCACGIYLWQSRVTWRAGPPAHMRVSADGDPWPWSNDGGRA